MEIKSLAPWFGGKREMAPCIIEQLGPHRSYWEPFCGSMAVLLAKPESTSETVNDLHKDLVNLARVIRHPSRGPVLYRMLRRTLFHQELFEESLAVVREPPLSAHGNVERAYHYFVASWAGRNGVAGTPNKNTGLCRRFSNAGGDPGGRWTAAVRSIPAWRRRLASVTILCDDGIELLGKLVDQQGTAVYCDPPYLVKGASYVHDFADEDHGRLAEALRRFKMARVVVSYYAHPRLAELYPGWSVLDCARAKHLTNAGQRNPGKQVAPEVLLVNGAPFGAAAPSLFGGDS